jgi:predicted enzyme related to lactoylglutathione lyase
MMIKINSKFCLPFLFPLLLSCGQVFANEGIEQEQQGKLVWGDLYSSDVNASIGFYNKTFGWTTKKFGKNNARYHIFFDGIEPVAGVISRPTQRNQTDKALWIGSFTTKNIETVVAKAVDKKATVILKPHDFKYYGKRAVIADPQGGVVALLELDPTNDNLEKISNKWNWAQLFSVNTSKAASFYQHSLDYNVENVGESKQHYYLAQQGEVRASVVELPDSFEQRDRWVNFIEVDNLTSTLEKAIKNGAEIIYKPNENNRLAIIADPSGALLGLTEQESE